ncbi:10466_t:CDS:2, partial [Acaulospora colombiana]
MPWNKGSRSEKIFVDLNIIYANGNEYSFEELRAKIREYEVKTKVESTNDRAAESQAPQSKGITQLSNKTNSECHEQTIPRMSPTLLHPKKLFKRPSPTINTKAAFADIMELFNQPLNCEHSDDYKEDENSDKSNDQTPRRKKSDVPRTPQNNCVTPVFKGSAKNDALENCSNLRDNNRRVPFELMTPIQETSREYKSNCTTPFRLSE